MDKTGRAARIDKILMMLELYYEKEITEPVLELTHKLLADESVEDIAAAAKAYMSNGKNRFMPRAGELLDIIKASKSPTGSLEARAQQQWRLVLNSVKNRGLARGMPAFEDPITATIARTQFTWEGLCDLEHDKLNWAEKRFCDAYNLASELEPGTVLIENTAPKLKQLVSGIGEIDGK